MHLDLRQVKLYKALKHVYSIIFTINVPLTSILIIGVYKLQTFNENYYAICDPETMHGVHVFSQV